MRTGYEIREGSKILAERRLAVDREEQERQAKVRASFVRYLDKRLAAERRAA